MSWYRMTKYNIDQQRLISVEAGLARMLSGDTPMTLDPGKVALTSGVLHG